MDLFCTINGTEHKIMEGCTFAEEFNESLDSGVVTLPREYKIRDLLAYDDVYVYTKIDEKNNDIVFKGYPFDESNPKPLFYRHLLVDQFTEEVLTLGDTEEECTYKYKIELMSETKKLETIQLPNISVTQPISGVKLSVWELINRYVDMYSPDYRKKTTKENWSWNRKYTVDHNLEKVFSNVNSPDFTLNAPTLRSLLSKLFITKDMIPYVKDDVIYGMDISKRGKSFDLKDEPKMNTVVGSMTSDSYCDNLRRNYSDALSQDRTCHSVEYIGFRNSGSSLMTIKNMRLELGMPIYKINKMYMCYYKKIKVNYSQTIQRYANATTSTDLTKKDPRVDPTAVVVSGNTKTVYRWGYPADKTNFKAGEGTSINYNFENNTYNFSFKTIDVSRWKYIGLAEGQKDTYNPEWAYKKGDKAYIFGLAYESLVDNNKNNTPCLYIPLSANEEGVFLCKQDITKLVQLNTRRDLLSQDWEDLHKGRIPQNIDDMAKYKFCTVGYDIGSKNITGWGDMYSYPTFWNDNKYTYIQNIASKLDYFYPTGVNDSKYIGKCFAPDALVFSALPDNFWSIMVAGTNVSDQDTSATEKFFSTVVSPFTNPSLKLKSFFFIVDYEGFYNGALIHTKDNKRDDITINDNSSESLTLIEQDGVFQHEKVNRFGNKALQIGSRYDSFYSFDDDGKPVENLRQVSDVLNSVYEKDVVLYHREYSIWGNCVDCIYYGTKNYVLKNYFTSVYARYRTWNLMSYNESVQRAENIKNMILWDKDKLYYDDVDFSLFKDFLSKDNTATNYITKVLSFAKPWSEDNIVGVLEYKVPDSINSAYIVKDGKKYASDMNSFVSKNSMCFNMRMFDNYSQGVYISQAEPFIETAVDPDTGDTITEASWKREPSKFFNVHDDYSGSKQNWVSIVDSDVTGYSRKLGFYVAHKDDNAYIPDDKFSGVNSNYVKELYSDKILRIPYINLDDTKVFDKIGVEKDFYKDNKELLDVTMQIENIKRTDDLIFTPWIMRLSDLLGDKTKFDSDIEKTDQVFGNGVSVYASNYYCHSVSVETYLSNIAIIAKIPKSIAKQDFSAVGSKSYDCNIFIPLYYGGSIDDKTKVLMTDHSVLLYSFRIKKIIFDKTISEDLKTPTCHARAIGEISMIYVDDNMSFHNVSYAEYCIYLGCVNWKQSISGGMIPNSYQDYDNCGVSADEDFVYLSNVYIYTQNFSYENRYNWYYKNVTTLPFGYAQMEFFGGEIGEGLEEGPSQFNKFYVTNNFVTEASNTYSQFFYTPPSFSTDESWFDKYLTDCPTIANAGEITGSGLAIQHAIYHKNMFIVFSKDKIEENTLQSDIKFSEFKTLDNYDQNDKVSDYFSVKHDSSGSYLEVNMLKAVSENKTFYNNGKRNLASIQIWYLDDSKTGYSKETDPFGLIQSFKYNPDDCYCHFVFGANVKQEDYDTQNEGRKNIKIYLSLINKKDDRVFDKYHKSVGVLSNRAIFGDGVNVKLWSPVYQQYESIENLKNAKAISYQLSGDYSFLDRATFEISKIAGNHVRIFSYWNVDICYSGGKFLLYGKTANTSVVKEIAITDNDYINGKLKFGFKYIYNSTKDAYNAEVYINNEESPRATVLGTQTPTSGIVYVKLFGSQDVTSGGNPSDGNISDGNKKDDDVAADNKDPDSETTEGENPEDEVSEEVMTYNVMSYAATPYNATSNDATFILYSLNMSVYGYVRYPEEKRSMTLNFKPCEAVGLQDESDTMFLIDKNSGAKIEILNPSEFVLHDKAGKEFTL